MFPLGSSLIRRFVLFSASTLVATALGDVADPLELGPSLQTLDAHPRVIASTDLVDRFPRRPALYLDCHALAFANIELIDPKGNQPFTALLTPKVAQQLEVMERFFDVLLADLSFASESEAMAVAYIQFDRASVRRELGQVSELRVLELEAVYQQYLHRRTASEISQQLTRSALAAALGHPEEMPRNLTSPTLPTVPDELPRVDELLGRALDAQAVRSLNEGRRQNDLRLIELELRQQILELLLRLRVLSAAERSIGTEAAWRDLKLDESRALYDQEVTADLGYSMSQQTRTRLQEQRLAFCRSLTWAQLKGLTGQPVWTSTSQDP